MIERVRCPQCGEPDAVDPPGWQCRECLYSPGDRPLPSVRDDPALLVIGQHLIDHGPISIYRVSSAQAAGTAKAYPYWGAVRYLVRPGEDGYPVAVAADGPARSDRRSLRLAEQDARERAAGEGAIYAPWIRRGRLSPREAARLLDPLQ